MMDVTAKEKKKITIVLIAIVISVLLFNQVTNTKVKTVIRNATIITILIIIYIFALKNRNVQINTNI